MNSLQQSLWNLAQTDQSLNSTVLIIKPYLFCIYDGMVFRISGVGNTIEFTASDPFHLGWYWESAQAAP